MKKFISSVLTGLALIGMLGMLTFASTEAGARGHSSGARSHASGTRSHTFHRSARVGVFVGAPIIASPPWYYPDPYYGYGPYYPPVVVQEQATVYIEQQAPLAVAPAPSSAPQAQPQQYWYYCEDSKTYYPYVQDCTTPWQRVVPHAPQ